MKKFMKAFFGTALYGLLMLIPGFVSAQDKKLSAEEYIAIYKDIAISEMMRSGVPASITLAQGLLESGNGNSLLAKDANNHFGIKCKKDWVGKTINVDDDAPQECFRVYDNAEASYIDHSDFLRNNTRYASLFELEPTDYKGWANGLKAAGYATNPRYPELLISAIEKYSLYQYDAGNTKQPIIKDKPEEKIFVQKEKTNQPNITSYNNKPVYVVKQGDTYYSIAKNNRMMPWQVKKYNDLEETDPLQPGTVLYLKPKNRKATEDFHVMANGENMYYISQKYAVRLSVLYKWNLIGKGQEPAIGEIVYLRKKRTAPPKLQPGNKIIAYKKGITVGSSGIQEKPKTTPEKKIKPDDNLVAEKKEKAPKQEKKEVIKENEKEPKVKPEEPKKEQFLASADTNIKTPIYNAGEKYFIPDDNSFYSDFHTVRNGETMEKLAARYKTSIKQIQAWNEMNDEVLYPGQLLRVRGKEDKIEKPEIKTEPEKVKEEPVEENLFDENSIVNDAVKEYEADVKTEVKKEVKKEVETKLETADFYTVQPGETLYGISRKFNIPVADLKKWNRLEDGGIKVGQQIKVKPQPIENKVITNVETQYHTVQPGETLYAVSRKYNLSVDRLKTLNNLTENGLSVGQKLKIKE